MQEKYSPEKLKVVLLSVDESKAQYQEHSPSIYKKYGGDQWPCAILPNAFDSAMRFGDFGYGKVIVDAQGIVRSIGEHDLKGALKRVFGE